MLLFGLALLLLTPLVFIPALLETHFSPDELDEMGVCLDYAQSIRRNIEW